jgi:hypothetical protein
LVFGLFLNFGFAENCDERELEMWRELAGRDLRPVGEKVGFGIGGRMCVMNFGKSGCCINLMGV